MQRNKRNKRITIRSKGIQSKIIPKFLVMLTSSSALAEPILSATSKRLAYHSSTISKISS